MKGRACVDPWYQATELTVLQVKKKGTEREREREKVKELIQNPLDGFITSKQRWSQDDIPHPVVTINLAIEVSRDKASNEWGEGI